MYVSIILDVSTPCIEDSFITIEKFSIPVRAHTISMFEFPAKRTRKQPIELMMNLNFPPKLLCHCNSNFEKD